MKLNKTNEKGFSLIELLIVVAIILIIAAIAIPNLMRSKIAANQASAVGSLRTIDTAEVTYASTYNAGYSPSLGALGPPAAGSTTPTSANADLIDEVLAGGLASAANSSSKSGYTFTYTESGTPISSYTVTATAVDSSTGQNSYFTDQTNVIRFATSGTAAVTDSPLGG
jgi:type IV pilus assembly protein PilA